MRVSEARRHQTVKLLHAHTHTHTQTHTHTTPTCRSAELSVTGQSNYYTHTHTHTHTNLQVGGTKCHGTVKLLHTHTHTPTCGLAKLGVTGQLRTAHCEVLNFLFNTFRAPFSPGCDKVHPPPPSPPLFCGWAPESRALRLCPVR